MTTTRRAIHTNMSYTLQAPFAESDIQSPGLGCSSSPPSSPVSIDIDSSPPSSPGVLSNLDEPVGNLNDRRVRGGGWTFKTSAQDNQITDRISSFEMANYTFLGSENVHPFAGSTLSTREGTVHKSPPRYEKGGERTRNKKRNPRLEWEAGAEKRRRTVFSTPPQWKLDGIARSGGNESNPVLLNGSFEERVWEEMLADAIDGAECNIDLRSVRNIVCPIRLPADFMLCIAIII